jgi:tetratricopeptide (TPR) repeat protein
MSQWLDRALELLDGLKDETRDSREDGDRRFFMAECLHLLWLTSRLEELPEGDASTPVMALAILEGLVSEFPENPRYRAALAHAYVVTNRSPLSDRGLDATPQQREQLERAVAMAENLIRQYPDASEYKDLLGRCSCALADLWLDLGELEKTERLCRQGIALCDEAHETYPSTTFYHVGYLRARSLLAAVFRAQGHLAEAREMLLKALDGIPSMPPEMAGSAIVRRFQAEVFLQLSEIHEATGERPLSEEAAETAQELIEKLPPIMQRTLRVDRWKASGAHLPGATRSGMTNVEGLMAN